MSDLPVRRGTYRLGVFGSMMNPPHRGHVAVVNAAHAQLGLDRVAVVPAGDRPPHRGAPQVSARARLTMAVRAFADLEHVVVSDIEVERGERGEPGYMVDTLEELREMPALLGYDDLRVALTLIVGADQARSLGTWHESRRIATLARVAVVGRPGDADGDSDADCASAAQEAANALNVPVGVVRMEPIAISSTMVRSFAAAGDAAAVARLVPDAIVADVMRLYGPSAD